MLADRDILSPLAVAEAKIQNRIVAFLSLKDVLLKLGKSSSPIIAQRANALWAKQKELETELSTALANIEKFKQGAWTFSDITELTTFYLKMEAQIAEVNELKKEEAGVVPTGIDWMSWLPWLLVLGVPVVLLAKHAKSKGRG